MNRKQALTGVLLVLLGAAGAAAFATGALRKGDPVTGVSFRRPALALDAYKGSVVLVNFNGWT